MISVLEKIDDDFCGLLEQSIGRAAQETMTTLFGCVISSQDDNIEQQVEKPCVVCNVDFRQGLECVTLRLVFNYEFIYSLIDDLYEKDLSDQAQKEICDDAVSELANIMCNKIKLFLNSNGFLFYMDIPYIETSQDALQDDRNIINLHFTLADKGRIDNKNVLFIGMHHAQ